MSQRQQLERILEIDRRIRSGEFPNADRLATFIEVSRRVIFNDRDFMINRLGAPIEYDRNHGGWYYRDETWIFPSIIVTEGELLALFLSIEIAHRYLGTGLETSLRSAVDKVTKNIKGPVTVDLETLRSHYTFALPPLTTVNEQVLLDLHHAISNNQCFWMGYYTASRDDHTERTVDPYHLYNIRGDWYLIAFDHSRKEFRNFLVGRIEDWRVLPEQFKRDPGFSITKWMANAFQAERGEEPLEVAIRFDAQQARYIRERRWHETQQIEELAEGGLILHFQTSGLGEVKRWVMQYGSHAEVLKPESLRNECRSEIQQMERLYQIGG